VRKKRAPAKKAEALPRPKLDGARKRGFPERLTPQLATLVDGRPRGAGGSTRSSTTGTACWRSSAAGKARLVTRRGNDWTARFPAVAAAAAELGRTAVLDGEVVALTAQGASSFQALQNALGAGDAAELVFQAFDLPYLDGMDLTAVPLLERKEALRALLAAADPAGPLRSRDHVVGRGPEFHRQACALGLEGIISKRADARYQAKRTRDWLKVKCLLRQEFVIGGWTEPRGSRARFGALLLGVHGDDGALLYAGKVGTGFDGAALAGVHALLAPLERDESPFANHGRRGRRPAGVHWVEPELVCEIAFAEWTGEGILRHPVFQGLREDRSPAEVVRERPAHLEAGEEAAPERPAKAAPSPAPSPRPTPPSTRPSGPRRKTDDAEVAGVRVSSAGKVLFPASGLTKGDLARYYGEVGEWMLPHAADRPLTLVRCPEGVGGDCFYQKHGDRHFGEAVGRVMVAENDGEEKLYTYVDSVAGLVSLVQMGVVEMHTSNARRDRFERPDRFVIDLDPGPGVAWARTVEAAREVRALLEELGLASWVKTTGGKGLHVLVPLVRRHDWDDGEGVQPGALGGALAAAPRAVRHQVDAGGAEGEDLPRLPPQRPRRHLDLRLLRTGEGARRGLGAPGLGGALGGARSLCVRAVRRARAGGSAEVRSLGGVLDRAAVDHEGDAGCRGDGLSVVALSANGDGVIQVAELGAHLGVPGLTQVNCTGWIEGGRKKKVDARCSSVYIC
jgi:bifunctional non-homologous end joining protein LigD